MDSDCSTVQIKFVKREYQIELIEKIKEINAILFLPTGSGKTFIALEIIKHFQKDLTKPVSEGGKRTIFLVNTVALVEQHYTFLKRHCSLKITMLTGDLAVDLWKQQDWIDIENNSQIIIMTSQIYVNVLTHAYLHIKNANLIIFDECHHAVNKHPMREVMTFFDTCDEEYHPKVLGLSATLLNANTTIFQFSEQLKILEKTFRSKIITSTRVAEIQKFSTKAKEKFERFNSYRASSEVCNQIDEMMIRQTDILKNLKLKETLDIPEVSDTLMNDRGKNRIKLLKNCLSDLMVHLKEFGVYFCYIGCTSYIVQLYRIMFSKSNEEVYCIALLMMINLLKAIRKILLVEITHSGDINDVKVIMKNSSEKLGYLLNQLKNLSMNDKCIVFVERRMTAKILAKIIEIYFKEIKIKLAVDFMIGYSVHPLRNARENFKEGDFERRCNKKVMTNFRWGKINVLVASNVLEEGIDMPDCNVVFMYDFPKTFRSYVQSKGRARKEESAYVLLLDKDPEKCLKNIKDFRKLESELKHVVRTFDISYDSDNEDETEKGNDEETYTTPVNAMVTRTGAIPIIQLYCSSLPHDVFTQLTPYWWKNQVEDEYYCKLQLPMNAAIKELIKGPVCQNIREAKQAVAFKAVKMLHEMKALNDNLMPILAPYLTQDEEYWFPNWDQELQVGDGTRSLKREVNMKIPKYLEDCRPIPGKKCYLHVINIEAKYPEPTLRRRERCHRLLTSCYELGILTRRAIPQVCDFPVFSDLGEVEISIDTNHRSLNLTEKELLSVSRFHRELFLKAIQVVKKCLSFSDDENALGYYIVPLKPSKDEKDMMEINFEVVFKSWNILDVKAPSERERREERFTKNNYWASVVTPWYHKLDSEQSQKKKYFIITDIDENYNLDSPFPNAKYESFADFYKKVYSLVSLRPGQPMMEARPIPHNLDCLRPRVTSTQKSENSKAKKEQSIFMAPEFCMKQAFPSVYWYKSTVLPTVLHRLQHLLLAEEIREKIFVEAKIGTLDWKKDESDVLRVNEKYAIKKSTNTMKPAMPKKDDGKTESITSKKKSEGYSRRLVVRSRAEKCLTNILQNDEDLPIDLDRSKNVTPRDIEKFFKYISNSIGLDFVDEESPIIRAPSSTICERRLPDFEDPPKLMTLAENSNYQGPRQKEIFEALTPAGCNDIVDLERLETLGDSFLKFAVSFTIFVKYSTVNEGYLTTLKGRLVGNRNLLYCGNKLQLGSFIKANTFSAQNNWCPPGFALPEILKEMPEKIDTLSSAVIFHVEIPYVEQFSGTISKNTIMKMKKDVMDFMDNESNKSETQGRECNALSFYGKQSVSDKTIADAMEALIGVYLKSGGIKPAYNLLVYFGILPHLKFEDIIGARVPSPKFEKSRLTIEDLVTNYQVLENLLSYEFHDKSYIVQAVSHPSYLKNNMTDCYQTLEFIGDAVLDFLITSYIYEYCGNLPPGKLTDLRASLVNNNTFGALCVRLGLHKFLLSNNKKLTNAVNRFIDYQEQRNYEIHGNEMMILISEGDVKVAEEVEVPKVLGDLFESIAGAIYLDSGNDMGVVWKVYYNIMKEEIKKFSENIPINPIRALYEEPGLKVKFLKESRNQPVDDRLKLFLNKIEVPLLVVKNNKAFHYVGRGKNTDLCKRAAAKLALRDFGRTEFVI